MARRLNRHFMNHLAKILAENNHLAYGRDGEVNDRKVSSIATRADRRRFLVASFTELLGLGFVLMRPESLKEKHVQALADLWDRNDVGMETLHGRMSMLRVFARWIGKPGMVKDIEVYFPHRDMKRQTAAERNLAWSAKGIDADAIIRDALALDHRFGMILMLQKEFGLRVKESLELTPLRALSQDGSHLIVVDGTKGGMSRVVPILTDGQRKTLDMARQIVISGKGKRMRWDGLTYKKANDRFYALAEKVGLTKKDLGVTAHGLRHQYAQTRAHVITGHPTPIEMKPGETPTITWEEQHKADEVISLEMGHRRPDVTAAYYGTWGHSLREPNTTEKMLAKLEE